MTLKKTLQGILSCFVISTSIGCASTNKDYTFGQKKYDRMVKIKVIHDFDDIREYLEIIDKIENGETDKLKEYLNWKIKYKKIRIERIPEEDNHNHYNFP
ncbi:hypothetical protein HYX16_03135 [Candidatus Woesearchaeota archaeon]|nr:hypothetical protein [Candidatus Woesearchaeota archaeon]